jgi:hypothetical protein
MPQHFVAVFLGVSKMSNFEYANATDEQLLDWEFAAYEKEQESKQWERECAQIGWAERGGYKAGLARPV